MSDTHTPDAPVLSAVEKRANYAVTVCVAMVEALIGAGLGAQIPVELLEATREIKAEMGYKS